MNGLVALEVTISLVFIYLLYSLLASTLAEIWAARFGLRARNLERMIYRMLADTPPPKFWVVLVDFLRSFLPSFGLSPIKKNPAVRQFYGHTLVKSLAKNQIFSKPSYIKSETFADVLIDLLDKEKTRQDKDSLEQLLDISAIHEGQFAEQKVEELLSYIQEHADTIENAETIIKTLQQLDGKLAKHQPDTSWLSRETIQKLQLLLSKSQGDLEKFRVYLQQWFDEMGERASGWYKRKMSGITFFVGLILAVSFNVDTIGIVDKLSNNKEVLDATMAFIEKSKLDVKDSIPLDSLDQRLAELQAERDSLSDVISLGAPKIVKTRDWVESVKSDGGESWKPFSFLYPVLKFLSGYYSGQSYIGWILTAIALSFGSQFWFDLLNKLMKLRSSVKTIATSSEQQSTQSSKQNVLGNAG